MRGRFWLQLLSVSVLLTTLTATVSLFVYRSAAAPVQQESRRNIYLFLANMLESEPYPDALRRYERLRADTPSLGRSIWVLSDSGAVLASNTAEAPPAEWRAMPKPQGRHALSAKMPALSYFADLVLVRLDRSTPAYLLVRPERDTPNRALAGVGVSTFLLGLFGTTLGGLAMLFLAARRTSGQARDVMARMHAGNLKARFTIGKFDELGHLKLDFNNMADEIESLVLRLQTSENARRQLLQELSHDLRTPLTSLRTSIDALTHYSDRMSEGQRRECLQVAQSELDYFIALLEDLFLVAEIGAPAYRKNSGTVDLGAMLSAELHTRTLAQPQLAWTLSIDVRDDLRVEADGNLLLRLLRNGLDNAGNYARSRVATRVLANADQVTVRIEDDGAGIGADAARAFGERRKDRSQGEAGRAQLSLGLGSVIIKTIVQLHGGSVHIAAADAGTVLTVTLPRLAGTAVGATPA